MSSRPSTSSDTTPFDSESIEASYTSAPSTPEPVWTRRPGRRPHHLQGYSVDSIDIMPLSPTGTLINETSVVNTLTSHDGKGNRLPHVVEKPSFTMSIQERAPPQGNIALPGQGIRRLGDDERELVPLYPSHMTRWDRAVTVAPKPVTIQPFTTSFLTREDAGEWIPEVHPDGQLGFSRVYNKRRYVTLNYLNDADVRLEIDFLLLRMDTELSEVPQEKVPQHIDIYLEVSVEDDEYEWKYYIANHEARCLFWITETKTDPIHYDTEGVTSVSHLRQIMESEYWRHCEVFPHKSFLSRKLLRELSGILIHGTVDTMTSLDSTIPYSSEELRFMLTQVKHIHSFVYDKTIDDPNDEDEMLIFAATAISRLMHLFTHARFCNYYGEDGARLTRDQSVHGKDLYKPTWMVTLVSPALFFAPDTHLRGLSKIFVDGIITQKAWKSFVSTLKDEWIEFVLYATVLLNANVAFLAIPVTDNKPAQIMSLMSIVDSMGSIILGLLLVRQHRTKSKETAYEAVGYLNSSTHTRFGLEPLAIIYSLPYAMLMWGMVTFLVAIGFLCFHGTGLLESVILAPTWLAIGVLCAWTVINGWDVSQPSRTERFTVWLVRTLRLKKREVVAVNNDRESGAGAFSEKEEIETSELSRKEWVSFKGLLSLKPIRRRRKKGSNSSTSTLVKSGL